MKRTRQERLVFLCLFLTITTRTLAGCPAHTYRGLFGKCFPEIGGTVGQTAEHIKNEAQAQVLGPLLETWITQSRATSIHGAQPIPPQIRQALTGYIDDDSMNRARFKVGDSGVLNLAGLSVRYGDVIGGDVAAVTLNDVIVFRSADDAYSNPALWAHELTHVGQFQAKGVHGFAIAYARSSWNMEGPAYAKGDGFAGWYDAQLAAGNAGQSGGADQGSSTYYPVGFAWNISGAFVVQTGGQPGTAQQDEAGAIANCSWSFGNCGGTNVYIQGDIPFCFAIAEGGGQTQLATNQNLETAIQIALSNCEFANGHTAACGVAANGCNDKINNIWYDPAAGASQ